MKYGLIALLIASPALAQFQPQPQPPIAALSGDWNGDEMPDAVLLLRGDEGQADLQVFTGGYRGLEPAMTVQNAVYFGDFGGQTPGLIALTPTSFGITAQQIGIGRGPWTSQVTVAYRGGAYVVAGFTYDFYDRLDPGHYGTCDVNLLSGAYAITLGPSDGHTMPNDADAFSQAPDRTFAGQISPQILPLTDLDADLFPPLCNRLFQD